MRRKRLWFLEPLDAHTNEVFARELDDQLSPQVRKVRIGRESIKVWEVSPDRRDFFVRSKYSHNDELPAKQANRQQK